MGRLAARRRPREGGGATGGCLRVGASRRASAAEEEEEACSAVRSEADGDLPRDSAACWSIWWRRVSAALSLEEIQPAMARLRVGNRGRGLG